MTLRTDLTPVWSRSKSPARFGGYFEATFMLMHASHNRLGTVGAEDGITKSTRRVRSCEQYCSEMHGAEEFRRAYLSARELFFTAFFAEGGGHFFLFYSCRWIAALTEVLLLGAVAHHAGMRNFSVLLGLLAGGGFLLHPNYSVRGVRWHRGRQTPNQWSRPGTFRVLLTQRPARVL